MTWPLYRKMSIFETFCHVSTSEISFNIHNVLETRILHILVALQSARLKMGMPA